MDVDINAASSRGTPTPSRFARQASGAQDRESEEEPRMAPPWSEEVLQESGADWWAEVMSEGNVEDDYDLGRVIGRGAYSTVLEGVCRRTKERFAVKTVKLKPRKKHIGNAAKTERDLRKQRRKVLSEVYLTGTSNQPNIIKLQAFYMKETEIVMVLELMRGGSIFDGVLEHGGMGEDDARTVMRQLLGALAHFHSRNILHRDIKPENMLLKWPGDLGSLRIADLGFAIQLAGGPASRMTMAGTPAYLAPELIIAMQDGMELEDALTPAIDVWAAGAAMFIILGGYPPFEGTTTRELFRSILDDDLSFDQPCWEDVSEDARDLIRKLLTKDPEQRITAPQALEHKWMRPTQAPPHMRQTSTRTRNWGSRLIPLEGNKDPTSAYIRPSYFLKLQEQLRGAAGKALDASLREIFEENKKRGTRDSTWSRSRLVSEHVGDGGDFTAMTAPTARHAVPPSI
ncbi:unnamed protein product [Pedinophyceae sp. YPF-701]|nr:unnamed protein product [Pedinophyceae sp. YPF-701]